MKVKILLRKITVLLLVFTLSQAALAQDVKQVYAQAKQAKSDKDYDRAVELYKKVLGLSPDFSTGYYELGCVYALKGNKKEALDSLKTAAEKGYLYFTRMENDPDLKKIKSHKDFRALLKDRDEYIKKAADKTEQQWKSKLGSSFQIERDDKYKFIIAYEVSATQKANIIHNLKLTANSHAKRLFRNKPDYYLSVVVCKGGQSFTALLGAAYARAAGVYVHQHKTLYVRADTGIGTAIHEFTHALFWADALSRKQDMQPQWVVEGFGTLYESPAFTKSGELRSHLSWKHHWRLPGLQQSIRSGTYKGLNNLFYKWALIDIGHAYQMAKYLFLYLQEENLLYKFYEEYVKTYPENPTSTNTSAAAVKTLEKVLGQKISEFEQQWKEWVLSPGGKPLMGVYFDQSYQGEGAKIQKVEPDSPAQQGGMKPGDIIIKMDGKPVKDYNANQELLKAKKRGEEAVFTVKRDDKEIELTLKLGTWPKK